MPPAATGSAVLLGLGVEQAYNVPGSSLVGYDPIHPTAMTLQGTEGESPQVNRSGFVIAGVPGTRGGNPVDFAHPMTAGHLLEFLQHLTGGTVANGGIVKTEPETDVFQYVFEPVGPNDFHPTSFHAILDTAPVILEQVFGVRFGQVVFAIGNNELIPFRAGGFLSHGTRLGPAEADGGNTGTYTLGPQIRGLLADEAAGAVHVTVTRDVAGGGLQFKLEQTSGAPTFPGTAVDAVYGSDSQAKWQNAQQAGVDLGVWGENKDPIEILWPGDATDHGDLDVGDTWVFAAPGAWVAPAMPLLTGHQRFTSAHWVQRARAIGAGWEEILVNTGTLTLAHPLELDGGNKSRYPYDIIRVAQFRPQLEVARSLVDTFFTAKFDRHQRVDLETAFEGGQLGTGAYRESVTFHMPSSRIAGAGRPIANAGKIVETVALVGETDGDGNPPLTVTVVTPRDWTPAA